MATSSHNHEAKTALGLAHAGVIDYLGFDAETETVLLVIAERRPWNQPEEQLFQLQEKLNAYLSFVLDGEMSDAYPQFTGKTVTIRLETQEKPPEMSFGFLEHVYEQCQLQGITFEVVVKEASCGCGKSIGDCSTRA